MNRDGGVPDAPPSTAEASRSAPRASGRLVRSDGREGRPSLVDVAKGAADDLVDLVVAQIKLARAELAADAAVAVRRAFGLAVFVLPLVVGYVFAMTAAALFLGKVCGPAAAFLAIAAVQVVVGSVGARWSLRSLRSVRVLDHSSAQVASTVEDAVSAMSSPVRVHPNKLVARASSPQRDQRDPNA